MAVQVFWLCSIGMKKIEMVHNKRKGYNSRKGTCCYGKISEEHSHRYG